MVRKNGMDLFIAVPNSVGLKLDTPPGGSSIFSTMSARGAKI